MRVARPLLASVVLGLTVSSSCLQVDDRDFDEPGGDNGRDGGADASMGTGGSGGAGGEGGSAGSGGADAGSAGSSGSGGAMIDGDVPDAATCMEDADCDDGNACNGEEKCEGGYCTSGMPLDNETSCTITRLIIPVPEGGAPEGGAGDASVDASAGSDAAVGDGAAGDAAPVDNRVPRQFDGLCFEGQCLQQCDDIDDCDDNDPCTGQETCDGSRGVCVSGVEPTCDDGNDCTADRCDAAEGDPSSDYCVHELIDEDGDGHSPESLGECGDDCDDDDDTVFTGAPEICDNKDNDCDGEDEGDAKPFWYVDCDDDGFAESTQNAVQQCDEPTDPPAICGGVGDWTVTAPNSPENTDCDDSDPSAFPAEKETECDGVDNDCNGIIDDVGSKKWIDCDSDGYPASGAESGWQCEYETDVAPCASNTGTWTTRDPARPDHRDCNDNDTARSPGLNDCSSTYNSDGVDNDCDGVVDAIRYYVDCDDDNYAASISGRASGCTAPTNRPSSCTNSSTGDGWTTTYPYDSNQDCDDDNGLVYPNAGYQTTEDSEWGWDYNCDGEISKQYTGTGVSSESSCSLSLRLYFPGCVGTDGWTGDAAPDCGGTAEFNECYCSESSSGGDCFPYTCISQCTACSRRTVKEKAQGCR